MEHPSYIPGYKNINVATLYRPLDNYEYVNATRVKQFSYNPNFRQEPLMGPYIKEYYENSVNYQINKDMKPLIFHPLMLPYKDMHRQCNPLVAYPYGIPRDAKVHDKCSKCKGKKKIQKNVNKKKHIKNENETNDYNLTEHDDDNNSNKEGADNKTHDNSNISEENTIDTIGQLSFTSSLHSNNNSIENHSLNNFQKTTENECNKNKFFSNLRDLYNMAICRKKYQSISLNSFATYIADDNVQYAHLKTGEEYKVFYDNIENFNRYKATNLNHAYLTKNECYNEKQYNYNKQKERKNKTYNKSSEGFYYTNRVEESNKNKFMRHRENENNTNLKSQTEPCLMTKQEINSKELGTELDTEELLHMFNSAKSLKELQKLIKENKVFLSRNKQGKCTRQIKTYGNANASKKKNNKEKEKKRIVLKKKKTVLIKDVESSLSKEGGSFTLPQKNTKIKFKKSFIEKSNTPLKKKNEKKELTFKNIKNRLNSSKSLKLKKSTMNFTFKSNNGLQRRKSILKKTKSMVDVKLKKQKTLALNKKNVFSEKIPLKELSSISSMTKKKKLNTNNKSLIYADNKKNKNANKEFKRMLTRSKTKVYVDNKTKNFKKSEVKMITKRLLNPNVHLMKEVTNVIKQEKKYPSMNKRLCHNKEP
ncbi:conserved protein, unknown function [Hepatocystis sp. ex Piliocolobus tephrosceles]|nr:conserved protein, unknown function [Hepatocystis sp. ex Piliocolobus tephrosceles]